MVLVYSRLGDGASGGASGFWYARISSCRSHMQRAGSPKGGGKGADHLNTRGSALLLLCFGLLGFSSSRHHHLSLPRRSRVCDSIRCIIWASSCSPEPRAGGRYQKMRLRLILGVSLATLFWTCWAQTNQTAFLGAFAHIPACAVSVHQSTHRGPKRCRR